MKISSFVFLVAPLVSVTISLAACDREAPHAAPIVDGSTAQTVGVASVDAAKAAEPDRAGSVTITQTKASGTSLGAYFMETAATGMDCTTGASAGACTLKVCARSLIQGSTTRKTAGDILVSVGQFPSTIAPSKDGTTYWYAPRPLAPVKDGQLVEVKAAGGESIPAFEAAVTAPVWITLSKPVIPVHPKSLSIPQSAELEFAWPTATSGALHVGLARPEREKTTSVECTFEGAAKKGSIDKSLLASIPLGHVVFTIDLAAKTEVKAGKFAVTVAVSDSILSGGAEIVP